MTTLRLVPPAEIEDELTANLRAEVRTFIAEQLAAGSFTPAVDAWLSRWDEDFTAALAARGWLGMTVPREYGGHGRTFLERFVVTEELLAAGAPVAAHWIADRQIVPSLLKYGTESQKSAVPAADRAGRVLFRHRHERAGLRFRPGQCAHPGRYGSTAAGRCPAPKSGPRAHTSRTRSSCSPAPRRWIPQDRHAGLSQFIVDLHGPGIEIRPIISMNGAHHFNEVILDGTFVPDDMVFGEIGDGWRQVTSELAFERSGPERFLSTFVLLAACADRMAYATHSPATPTWGAWWRASPACTTCPQRWPARWNDTTQVGHARRGGQGARHHHRGRHRRLRRPRRRARFRSSRTLVQAAVDQRPGFTLRGGTNEVLRGVIARGTGAAMSTGPLRTRCRPGPGRHDGRRLRRVPREASARRNDSSGIRTCGSTLDDLGLVRLTGDEQSTAAAEPVGTKRPNCWPPQSATAYEFRWPSMICWRAGCSMPTGCRVRPRGADGVSARRPRAGDGVPWALRPTGSWSCGDGDGGTASADVEVDELSITARHQPDRRTA